MTDYISTLTGAQMDDALAQMNARVPEGWAVGKKDGVDVPSSSTYYHNNAKYYATNAGNSAQSASNSASTASSAATTAQSYTSHPPKPNNNAKWELWNGSAYVESTYPSRGEQGQTGAGASVTETKYGISASSTTQPTTWQDDIPTLVGGQFLWTRFKWNNNTYSYTVAKQGENGQGAGDMLKSEYDFTEAVANAGGIAPYVASGLETKANSGVVSLPSAYQQVEYIESTGTQYIDTGLKGKITHFKIVAKMNDTSTGQMLLGFNAGGVTAISCSPSSSTFKIALGNSQYTTTYSWENLNRTDTSQHTFEYDSNTPSVSVDNTIYYTGKYATYHSEDKNLFLFAYNGEGVITSYMNGDIYYFEGTDENKTVRLIPCKRNSDNAIGMYDIVSGTFLENQGTGTFLKGLDVKDNNYIFNKVVGVPDNFGNVSALNYSIVSTWS